MKDSINFIQEKIVELETKVKNLTTQNEKIVELETKVKNLTTEIDNLRDRERITFPNTRPLQTLYIKEIKHPQFINDKKIIEIFVLWGTCDVDKEKSFEDGINFLWIIDNEYENHNLILLSKIFEFDKFVLKKNNQIVDDDFFKDKSNKDSIFDFISSKTFPYFREFMFFVLFEEPYDRLRTFTTIHPEDLHL